MKKETRKKIRRCIFTAAFIQAFIFVGAFLIKLPAAAESDGSVSTAIVHHHEGGEDTGGGCYTEIRHQHSKENGCYRSGNCTVTVHGNGGFWSQGDAWCGCHGQVHEIYQNVIRKHSSCGAADQYTQIHFTEHHGPGTDGFRGYDSSTHGFDTLNCSREGEVLGYERKCGAAEGEEVAVFTLRPGTTVWTRELTLRASCEIKGNISIASEGYIWNDGSPSAQSEFIVEKNGTYTCRLNAGTDNNSAEALVSITVANIDRKGPEITSITCPEEWTAGNVTVSVQAGDLQEDGSEGSGLADEAYSFDGGSSWQGNTYTYMENGSYLIKVRDILGNTEEKEFNIHTIDRTAPKITVAQDTQANILTNTVTISAEDLQPDGEPGCGLAEEAYSFDGGKTWSVNNELIIKENTTLTAAVRDALGNIATQEISVSNIDTTPPEFSLSISPLDWAEECRITAEGRDKNDAGEEGAGNIQYSFDGGKTWSTGNSFTVTENGTYLVKGKDAVGNTAEKEITVNNIDRTGPTLRLTQTPQVWLYGNAVIKVEAQDLQPDGSQGCGLAEQPLSRDGEEWSTDTEFECSEPGTYTFYGKDLLGNISESTIVVRRFAVSGDDENNGGGNNGGGSPGEKESNDSGSMPQEKTERDMLPGLTLLPDTDISSRGGKTENVKKAENTRKLNLHNRVKGSEDKQTEAENGIGKERLSGNESPRETEQLTKTDRQQECICTDKCGKQGNESCPLCSLWPERCRAKGFQNTQLCLIILGISVFLGVFVLELLVYIRPVFLYGKKEKGSYGFAGILFVGKKEDLWQITLYKSRYDSYKTGEFRLQCGLWGYFHEGEPLMISLENLIFKKFEVSGKLDFRL